MPLHAMPERAGSCATCPCRCPACRSGADPGARDDNNETPVDVAEMDGKDKIADLLNQRQQLKRLLSSNSSRRLRPSLSGLGSRRVQPVEGEQRGTRGARKGCSHCARSCSAGWEWEVAPGIKAACCMLVRRGCGWTADVCPWPSPLQTCPRRRPAPFAWSGPRLSSWPPAVTAARARAARAPS